MNKIVEYFHSFVAWVKSTYQREVGDFQTFFGKEDKDTVVPVPLVYPVAPSQPAPAPAPTPEASPADQPPAAQ